MNNRIALFFDRAIYYFLVGFEESELEGGSELEQLYRGLLVRLRRDLGMAEAEKKEELREL